LIELVKGGSTCTCRVRRDERGGRGVRWLRWERAGERRRAFQTGQSAGRSDGDQWRRTVAGIYAPPTVPSSSLALFCVVPNTLGSKPNVDVVVALNIRPLFWLDIIAGSTGRPEK